MAPGWQSEHAAALERAASATGRPQARPVEDDFDFGTVVGDEIPEPYPRFAPTPALRSEDSVRVAPGFTASEKHLKPYAALERPLRLARVTDPATLEADLAASLPWLEGPVRHIVRSQALRARGGSPWFGFSPILLVGPQGVGKTRFAREVAERCGVPLKVFNAAGQSGAIEILGHSPTYREAHPSAPVAAMARYGVANPILLVDEIDKFGSSDYNGDPRDAILPMLERETARAFHDEYLRQEVDISQVGFIFTANSLSGLSAPLLDRLQVFKVRAPDATQVSAIVDGLVRETAGEFGLTEAEAPELLPEFRAGLGAMFREGGSIRKVKRSIRNALMASAGHAPH
jgi:hypothetical protein